MAQRGLDGLHLLVVVEWFGYIEKMQTMETVGSWLSKVLVLSMLSSSMILGQGGPVQGSSIQGSPIQGGPYYEEKRFDIAMYPALEPSKLWLNIERTTKLGRIRVDMCDKQGKVLFTEWLPKKDVKFHQCFDLSSIGDGTYTFIITDGVQRQERTFRLSTPGLQEQYPQRFITLK
ncbi:MAG: hypothetical protein JWP57_2501 [Spirosoma sp.]|nr:hypothetical protein [Spirosoma sp.]